MSPKLFGDNFGVVAKHRNEEAAALKKTLAFDKEKLGFGIAILRNGAAGVVVLCTVAREGVGGTW